MLVQLFVFVFCFAAVSVALMVKQLPDHRKLTSDMRSAETGLLVRSDHWDPHRATPVKWDYEDDPPHEEPELD